MEIDIFERATFALVLLLAAVDPIGWWLWGMAVVEVVVIGCEIWARSLREKRQKAESDICWKGL